jgi:hypothetical protein
MAAFIQIKSASVSSALTTLTFDAPVTAGNSIVVCIAKLNSALGLDSLTDDHSGSYSLVIHHADSGNRQIYQYVDIGAIGGTTTVTLDLAGIETFSWAIIEINAAGATSSAGDTSGNGTTHDAADVTNAVDDAIFVHAACANVGIDLPETLTAGDGYTARCMCRPNLSAPLRRMTDRSRRGTPAGSRTPWRCIRGLPRLSLARSSSDRTAK